MASTVRIKRVYEPASPQDGRRILVDRVWPRGIRREDAKLALWLKDVAPSTALRKWFGHDPARWAEFQRRYREELKSNPAVEELRREVSSGRTTLVYGAHDTEHNQAVVLADYLAGARE